MKGTVGSKGKGSSKGTRGWTGVIQVVVTAVEMVAGVFGSRYIQHLWARRINNTCQSVE